MESTSGFHQPPDHNNSIDQQQHQQQNQQHQQQQHIQNANEILLAPPAALLPAPLNPLQIFGQNSSAAQQPQPIAKLSRPMVFDKMEALIQRMSDKNTGVVVKDEKSMLRRIPSAFQGSDLYTWLEDQLRIEESECHSIANQLCLHGYFFPVNEWKTLGIKDENILFRFQIPYFWPWQHKAPDNVDYAIYLLKRSMRNKQRHALEDYENDALASLHKNLKAKWDFITMQAKERLRQHSTLRKSDKIVYDSQERAFWRVHRPPPGQFTPLEPCPVPLRDRQNKPKKRTIEDCQREIKYLESSSGRTRMKMSQACESLIQYWDTFQEYDYFLTNPVPTNPWVTEDLSFWQLNKTIVERPYERRVKRWSISIEELVTDPTGLQEFTNYLRKEYSHENIRFWIAVNDLRHSANSQIAKKVTEIYEEFLEPGAPCEINIDGKTMEVVQHGLKNPSRYTFDAAAEHIYTLLLKKDCYPRFIRSEHYKNLLENGIQQNSKKRFFGFGGAAKKKSTSSAPPPTGLHPQASAGMSFTPTATTLHRRRGSDRSLSGSAHELAIAGVKDGSNKVPHSHSQSNLSEIPYSVVIYRGDMPSSAISDEVEPNKISSTATGVNAALVKSNQDSGKSYSESLEPTLENVCPWEMSIQTPNPPSATKPSSSVCPWDEPSVEDIPKQVATSSESKPLVQSKSVNSSDVSEMSDKFRRSCGIRQNTLDCDVSSSKRLTPTVVEHRRASMTTAPMLQDLPITFTLPTTEGTLKTSISDSGPCKSTQTAHTDANPCSDERQEEKNSSQQSLRSIGRVEQHTIKIISHDDYTNLNQKKIESPCKECAMENKENVPTINVSTVGSPSISSSTSEANQLAMEKTMGAESSTEYSVSKRTSGGICHQLTDDSKQMSLEIGVVAEEHLPPDDMSPGEYQEGMETDDFDEDIATTSADKYRAGYVAPAPTPAPSIAPLAEGEIDAPDDEFDVSGCDTSDPKPETSEIKRKRRKRDGDIKQEKIDDGQPCGSEKQKQPAQDNINTVCPWEDEDSIKSSSEDKFVKTYATLGYL